MTTYLEIAPAAINGPGPDTGNMELLHLCCLGEMVTSLLQGARGGVERSSRLCTTQRISTP